MKTPRYYALRAFGFPGHPFPGFYDNYKTLALARNVARQLLRDGWREVEIVRDATKPADFVGVPREFVETHGVAP